MSDAFDFSKTKIPAKVAQAKSNKKDSTPELEYDDKRGENVSQLNLQDIADKSKRNQHLSEIESNANESSNVTQLMNLNENINLSEKQDLTQQKENTTGLPDDLKSGVESLSGHSMDDVKVYRNSEQPAQLQASAYAQGTDIHLGPGQEKHLPHEAWHVVQQKEGRVQPNVKMNDNINVNNDPALENEADRMGAKASSFTNEKSKNQGRTLQLKSSNDKVVQMTKPAQEKPTIGKTIKEKASKAASVGIEVAKGMGKTGEEAAGNDGQSGIADGFAGSGSSAQAKDQNNPKAEEYAKGWAQTADGLAIFGGLMMTIENIQKMNSAEFPGKSKLEQLEILAETLEGTYKLGEGVSKTISGIAGYPTDESKSGDLSKEAMDAGNVFEGFSSSFEVIKNVISGGKQIWDFWGTDKHKEASNQKKFDVISDMTKKTADIGKAGSNAVKSFYNVSKAFNDSSPGPPLELLESISGFDIAANAVDLVRHVVHAINVDMPNIENMVEEMERIEDEHRKIAGEKNVKKELEIVMRNENHKDGIRTANLSIREDAEQLRKESADEANKAKFDEKKDKRLAQADQKEEKRLAQADQKEEKELKKLEAKKESGKISEEKYEEERQVIEKKYEKERQAIEEKYKLKRDHQNAKKYHKTADEKHKKTGEVSLPTTESESGLIVSEESASNPKLEQLTKEYAMAKEFYNSAVKSTKRSFLNVSLASAKILGSSLILSGVGGVAGGALKGAAVATQLGATAYRNAKQHFRDKYAKSGWDAAIKGYTIFDRSKSTYAKVEWRKKQAQQLWDQSSDPKYKVDDFEKFKSEVKNFKSILTTSENVQILKEKHDWIKNLNNKYLTDFKSLTSYMQAGGIQIDKYPTGIPQEKFIELVVDNLAKRGP